MRGRAARQAEIAHRSRIQCSLNRRGARPEYAPAPSGRGSCRSPADAVFSCTFASEDPTMKRTYQPSKVRRARTHGFLVRMKTRGGRAVINARRAKGRKRIAL